MPQNNIHRHKSPDPQKETEDNKLAKRQAAMLCTIFIPSFLSAEINLLGNTAQESRAQSRRHENMLPYTFEIFNGLE